MNTNNNPKQPPLLQPITTQHQLNSPTPFPIPQFPTSKSTPATSTQSQSLSSLPPKSYPKPFIDQDDLQWVLFERLGDIKDPEFNQTLAHLEVISESSIQVTYNDYNDPITITVIVKPTVPHCSFASLIGLCVIYVINQVICEFNFNPIIPLQLTHILQPTNGLDTTTIDTLDTNMIATDFNIVQVTNNDKTNTMKSDNNITTPSQTSSNTLDTSLTDTSPSKPTQLTSTTSQTPPQPIRHQFITTTTPSFQREQQSQLKPRLVKTLILLEPGSHNTEKELNKQFNDKERVLNAFDNITLLQQVQSLCDKRLNEY